MTIDEALALAGDLTDVPEAAVEAIREAMPRYLWVDDHYAGDFMGWPDYDDGRDDCRMIHCEACGQERVELRRGAAKLPHNDRIACPMCGARVQVKHMGKGFKNVYDRLDAVYYKKSPIDPNVVVACAAHCFRPFGLADRAEPWTLEARIDVRGLAVFRWGEGGTRLQTRLVWMPDDSIPGFLKCDGVLWVAVKAMTCLTFGDESGFMQNAPHRILAEDTLRAAIAGTPFERAWSDQYVSDRAYNDGVAALDLIAREPVCEYLHKIGAGEIVAAKLRGALPPRLINWRGRRAAEVLRISQSRWGELKGQKIMVEPGVIAVIQLCDRMGWRCGAANAARVAWLCRLAPKDIKASLARALELLPAGKRSKALKYLAKQAKDAGLRRIQLSDFEDYWGDCADTGANMEDEREIFPDRFPEAHDRLTARRKIVADRALDRKIRQAAPELDRKYGFSFGGLILRPAATAAEVVREGEVLGHCVGGYVARYASGDTLICVLRRAVQPDAPWRTVEILPRGRGRVIQDRGYKNDWAGGVPLTREYRAMLALFWEAWAERTIARATKERETA